MNPTALGQRTLMFGMAHCPRSEMKPICLLTGFMKILKERKKKNVSSVEGIGVCEGN